MQLLMLTPINLLQKNPTVFSRKIAGFPAFLKTSIQNMGHLVISQFFSFIFPMTFMLICNKCPSLVWKSVAFLPQISQKHDSTYLFHITVLKKNDNQHPSHKRQIVNRIEAYSETAWKSKTGSEVSMNLHYFDLEAAPLRGISSEM